MQWRRPPRLRLLRSTIALYDVHAAARAWRVVAAGLLASLAWPAPAVAQWRAEAGVGAARVTQPENPVRAASTADASLEWIGSRASAAASGGITLPASDDRRVQGELAASVRTDPRRAFGIEASGVASAYDERQFSRMLSGFAGLRAHARAGRVGAWGGVAAGTLDDATYTYPHTVWEAGVVAAWRLVRVAASAARNSTLGEPRIEFIGDPPLQVTVRDALRYTDAVLAVHARPARLELDGRLGTRSVQRTIAYEERPPGRVFGDVSATWRVTPRLALAASLGHALADLGRGLPEARYATLGMRVRLHDSSPSSARPAARGRIVAGAAPDVLIERGSTAGAVLRVLASSTAHRVEVAGTFTEWEPLALRAAGGGAWALGTPLQAGQHRIMVRVDGGEWMAPANLPSVDDDVGGRVGLFTVAGDP